MMRRISLVGRSYQFRMRVPRRFSSVETRKEIYASLKTGDLLKAEARAAQLEDRLEAMWEARLAGENPDFKKIVRYCQTLGFAYKPAAEQTDADFLARMAKIDTSNREGARALYGTVTPDDMRISSMAEEYEKISSYRLTKKNEEQMRMWRNTFKRCAREFVDVCGDKLMSEVTVAEALQYKEHFRARVEAGEMKVGSANRSLGAMSTMYNAINEERKLGLPRPFSGVRLKEFRKERVQRKPLSNEMIENILAPGALGGINNEARDILHICINTGCRPSEICGVLPHHMHLDAEVPHFDLLEEDRELKTSASIRKVVLVGIALDAMRRRRDAGGFPRYKG